MKSNLVKLSSDANEAPSEEAISNVFVFADFEKNSCVESYAELEDEFRKNELIKSETKEAKEIALSYIKRIMKSDANAKLKAYWENQSDIINQEIREIEAMHKAS